MKYVVALKKKKIFPETSRDVLLLFRFLWPSAVCHLLGQKTGNRKRSILASRGSGGRAVGAAGNGGRSLSGASCCCWSGLAGGVADVLERRPAAPAPLQFIPLSMTDGLLSPLAVMPRVYLGDEVEAAGNGGRGKLMAPAWSRTLHRAAGAAGVSRPRSTVAVYSLFQDQGPRASSVPGCLPGGRRRRICRSRRPITRRRQPWAAHVPSAWIQWEEAGAGRRQAAMRPRVLPGLISLPPPSNLFLIRTFSAS
jgi:hypothetical protein